ASDCPFDPEQGTMYPRVTMQILDSVDLPKEDRDMIYYGNLEAVTGRRACQIECEWGGAEGLRSYPLFLKKIGAESKPMRIPSR
ncbi:MAG: hypothetical protein WBX25_25335, partial [Rhodomicrobium sp.]